MPIQSNPSINQTVKSFESHCHWTNVDKLKEGLSVFLSKLTRKWCAIHRRASPEAMMDGSIIRVVSPLDDCSWLISCTTFSLSLHPSISASSTAWPRHTASRVTWLCYKLCTVKSHTTGHLYQSLNTIKQAFCFQWRWGKHTPVLFWNEKLPRDGKSKVLQQCSKVLKINSEIPPESFFIGAAE